MVQKKTTRLKFSEKDLRNPRVKKAASKARQVADRADQAKERLPTKRKLRWEREGAGNTLHHERGPVVNTSSRNTNKKSHQCKQMCKEAEQGKRRKGKLKFEEAEAKKPSVAARKLTQTPVHVVTVKAHQEVNRNNEDDNAGVHAGHFTESAAEGTFHAAEYASYSRKLKKYRKAERLEVKADAANVEALYQKSIKDNSEAMSNPISRFRQKQAIKKEYAAMKAGQSAGKAGSTASGTAKGTKKAGEGANSVFEKAVEFAKTHSHVILVILAAALILLVISGMVSSCSVMMNSGGNVILGTSFTAEDADIKGADEDFTTLENELQREIDNIESSHPGYDEYRYNLAQIGHNPYELAALLTVQFEDYTRSEVQGELRRIFDAQYELILEEEVEIRTRTETRTGTSTYTDPETGESYEEEYE